MRKGKGFRATTYEIRRSTLKGGGIAVNIRAKSLNLDHSFHRIVTDGLMNREVERIVLVVVVLGDVIGDVAHKRH